MLIYQLFFGLLATTLLSGCGEKTVDAKPVQESNECPSTRSAYDAARANLVQENDALSFDAQTTLTAVERKADKKLASMRDEYVKRTKKDGSFHPARFFHSWNLTEVQNEDMFKFIDKLPKGGNLHLHSGSFGSVDFILDNGLAMEGCHLYMKEDTKTALKGTIAFFKDAPSGFEPFEPCATLLVSNANLRQELRSLWTSNEALANVDSTRAWDVFQPIFKRLSGATKHRPLLMKYLFNTFELSFASGLTHMEIRVGCGANNQGALHDLVNAPGKLWAGHEIIDTYEAVHKEFQNSRPERKKFSFAIIAASFRFKTPEKIVPDLEFALALRQKYPKLVVGWDAVAQEDPFERTAAYVTAILHLNAEAKRRGEPSLPLYLHDGESTNREDDNVIDAVLVGCRRIGHGFNTGVFFPAVREEMKSRGIAIEVNPISNQILRYVDNIETHPAAGLAFDGVAIVIGSDDPGIFGYVGNSYDWWVVTAAWRLDLKSLKTLAHNSLSHSALVKEDKDAAIKVWENDWELFLEKFVGEEESLIVNFL